jgi:hypothetical protein
MAAATQLCQQQQQSSSSTMPQESGCQQLGKVEPKWRANCREQQQQQQPWN